MEAAGREPSGEAGTKVTDALFVMRIDAGRAARAASLPWEVVRVVTWEVVPKGQLLEADDYSK